MGDKTIKKNINDVRRFLIFNLSTFDCLTEEERKLYNKYKKCNKKDEKADNRKAYEDKIASFSGIRSIPDKAIYYDGVRRLDKMIAGFENECVRLSKSFVFDEKNPKDIPFIPEIIILDCWSETILSQIIDNGLSVDNKKYIFYSSSANQQKKKQVCLMEEQFFYDNCKIFMCGLTLDIINKQHGCNTGKFLAYTSLIFSKSVECPIDISIDEVLILPEFETYVTEKVNYLDMENHTIEVKEMPVPVNHMDGAGMVLPETLSYSAQIRGGWIKGCIFPFDFRQFIIENIENGRISADDITKDVWGNDVSIGYIKDKIKVILNGSQLKMWKYYKSADEYRKAFNECGLKICINNVMHYPETDNPITPSAYQFYQTISRERFTDEAIHNLCKLSIQKINDAKMDVNTALEIMGIDVADEDVEYDPLKACIKVYPAMLQDEYVKKRIDSKIKSMRKKAMSGKPLIKGFYNYICPDLYAACEYWFCKDENPQGLIPKNHVYNSFYNDKEDITEVCCLRSPHLSDCEHGIRNLIKTDECKRWFKGMDTVISTHDLLTKNLVCDVDGDETLIVHDRAFIDLVDRNKLPLYYEMPKAEAKEVNNENIKQCLHNSFENSVIGEISNAITKHLNMQAEPDLEFIRFMTAYNNFCIDFPKSQYMPELPEKYIRLFELLKSDEIKFPYFFKFAKGKKTEYCYDAGNSNVDRISRYIMKNTSSDKDNIWDADNSEKSDFNPQYFQSGIFNVDRKSEEYIEIFKVLAKLKSEDTQSNKKRIREKCKEADDKYLEYDTFYYYCSGELLNIIGIRKKLVAYLVDIEYCQEVFIDDNKEILWNCFGDILYENLCVNLKKDSGEIKTKKNAYIERAEREEKIAKMVKEMKDAQDKEYQVPIYQNEMDYILNMECRKNSQYDRYLLYLLIVNYKRKLLFIEHNPDIEMSEASKKHIKIYKNKRLGQKITKATFDKWIEHDITDKGLKRLEKGGIISVEDVNCNKFKYYKVSLNLPFSILANVPGSTPLFYVGAGNPLYYYYLYTGERLIKECEICGNLFPAVGNTKTCSDKCSDALRLLNKNTA